MKLICTRGAREEYFYPLKKKHYYSVSQCLFVLDPDAFSGVDPFVMQAAQQRGTDLHVIFGLLLLAHAGLGEAPKRPAGLLGGYFDAMLRFLDERKPRPIRIEESSVNEAFGYAGTPDTESILDDDDDWIIDLKTGNPRPVHACQLHAYKRMQGYEQAKKLGSLYIRKNGTYKLEPHHTDYVDWSGFQSAITVLNWRRLRGN